MVSRGFATLKLLAASVMIALSGVFRLYIAYLFIGYVINVLNIIAGFLIIYAIYTFDRVKGGEEDNINRNELTCARKDIALIVCVFSFFLGALLLFLNDLILVIIIPFIIGYLYTRKINIRGFSFKLKGGLGTKNVVVAMTWGIFITGIVSKGCDNYVTILFIFTFFFVKTFINTVMNDFGDVAGDRAAGLRTLPVYFGEKKTRILLMLIHLLEHILIILIMINTMLEFEFIIIFSCFFSGLIYIIFFSSTSISTESKIKNVSYHLFFRWEFYVAVGLQTAYQNFM